MKHLTITLLTLLMSMGAWAEDINEGDYTFYKDSDELQSSIFSSMPIEEIKNEYSSYKTYKALARPIYFGKTSDYGAGVSSNRQNQMEANNLAISNCQQNFHECIIFYEGDNEVWESNQTKYFEELAIRQEKTARMEMEREKERKKQEQKSRQEAFNRLYSTCLSYGFEERSDIASCIQQEIFNEKRLAILEQQKLAQNQEQVEKQEETNIWLNILEGVTDNLSDPLFWENARLNQELKRRPLKRYPAPPIKENPNK